MALSEQPIDHGFGIEMALSEQPIDHGFAWAILFGATLEMALVTGMSRSSGILFIAFQEKFHSSSSMTSLVSTVQFVCFSLIALLVMTVGIKLTTCRKLIFVGNIILCVSYIVTSQARDIRLLLLSHGVLNGTGNAFIEPTVLIMLGKYFDKRRGLANSIAASGSSFGGLIFAPIIAKLLSTYGYQGCILLIGGIVFHGCICGALFRPTSFYTARLLESKNNKQEALRLITSNHTDEELSEHPVDMNINKGPHIFQDRPNSTTTTTLISDLKPTESSHGNLRTSLKEISGNLCGDSSTDELHAIKRRSVRTNSTESKSSNVSFHAHESPIKRPCVFAEPSVSDTTDAISSSKVTRYTSSEYITGSQMSLPVALVNDASDHIDDEVKGCLQSCVNTFDYKLFRVPVFVAFLLASCFLCPGTALATVFIAPYARDVDISVDDVAILVTIFSAVDMCSRIVVGVISDMGWLRRSTIVGIATVVVSLSAHLLRFYLSYTILMCYAVLLGMVSGVYFSLYAVVIVDYMTIDRLHSCIGFVFLVHGFSAAGSFYMVGYLRDVTGSYIVPHHVIGVLALLGAVIMFLLPLIERFQTSRKRSSNSET